MTRVDAHFSVFDFAHSVDLAWIIYFWKFEYFCKKEAKIDFVEAPPFRVVHVLIQDEERPGVNVLKMEFLELTLDFG